MIISAGVTHRLLRPLVTEASRSSFYPGDPRTNKVYSMQVKARVVVFQEVDLP
jgi:hypothetical protein